MRNNMALLPMMPTTPAQMQSRIKQEADAAAAEAAAATPAVVFTAPVEAVVEASEEDEDE